MFTFLFTPSTPIIEVTMKFGGEPSDTWMVASSPPPLYGTMGKPESLLVQSRSAGGHIHIDDNIARSSPVSFVQTCDLYLGLPSLLMDTAGQERRALYGRGRRKHSKLRRW